MMEVRPEYLTLDDLFTKRLFTIPKYQRAYSWTKEQRRELFQDIEDSFDNKEIHFMSTIVGLVRGKQELDTDNYLKIDIVDGQQRITTLIILLKAIANILQDSDLQSHGGKMPISSPKATINTPPPDFNSKKIADQINEMLLKPDNITILLTNHDEQDYFKNYIRGDKNIKNDDSAETRSNRELLSAIKDCEEVVRKWRHEYRDRKRFKVDLVAHIKNKLTFVFHKVEKESLVYSVFEVLNSRGIDVSWLDKLKSQLMYAVFKYYDKKQDNSEKVIEELHNSWYNIYKAIGLRQTVNDDLLSFVATLKSTDGKRLRKKDALAYIMTKTATPEQVVKITKFISQVAKILSESDNEIRKKVVNKIAEARLLRTAIKLANLSDGEEKKVINEYEKITFRIYGLARTDARKFTGEYIKIARNIMQQKLSVSDMITEISQIGKDIEYECARKELTKKDLYPNYIDELKYILFQYEEYLTRKRGKKRSEEEWDEIWKYKNTVEHIMPQNFNYEYIHYLGNLLLLPPGINSEASDKRPSEKHDLYKRSNLLIANDVLNDLSGWTGETVKSREQKLLKWIKKTWWS